MLRPAPAAIKLRSMSQPVAHWHGDVQHTHVMPGTTHLHPNDKPGRAEHGDAANGKVSHVEPGRSRHHLTLVVSR